VTSARAEVAEAYGRWTSAITAHDAVELSAVHDDEFHYVGPDGQLMTRAEHMAVELLADVEEQSVLDLEVVELSPDVIVSTGRHFLFGDIEHSLTEAYRELMRSTRLSVRISTVWIRDAGRLRVWSQHLDLEDVEHRSWQFDAPSVRDGDALDRELRGALFGDPRPGAARHPLPFSTVPVAVDTLGRRYNGAPAEQLVTRESAAPGLVVDVRARSRQGATLAHGLRLLGEGEGRQLRRFTTLWDEASGSRRLVLWHETLVDGAVG
jgi:hypothetical protein